MSRGRFMIVAVVVVLGAMLYYVYGGSAAPPGQPPLTRIDSGNFGELRASFNAAKDSTRIVAMLSPT